MKNAMEVSLSMIGKIDLRYDMNRNEMNDIYQAMKNDAFGMMYAAFRIGYLKGMRAEKNSHKKSNSIAMGGSSHE